MSVSVAIAPLPSARPFPERSPELAPVPPPAWRPIPVTLSLILPASWVTVCAA